MICWFLTGCGSGLCNNSYSLLLLLFYTFVVCMDERQVWRGRESYMSLSLMYICGNIALYWIDQLCSSLYFQSLAEH